MLRKLKLRSKVMISFGVLLFIFAVSGWVQINNARQMKLLSEKIFQRSTNIDAAMEMKLAIARTMQMIMEFIVEADKASLEVLWKEHQGFIEEYQVYSDAIMNGADTDEGIIYATENERIRSIIKGNASSEVFGSPRSPFIELI